MAGQATLRSATVAGLVRPASDPDVTGRHRVLPMASPLGVLLPGGALRRGTTVPAGGLPDGGLPDGGLPDGGLPDGGLPDGVPGGRLSRRIGVTAVRGRGG